MKSSDAFVSLPQGSPERRFVCGMLGDFICRRQPTNFSEPLDWPRLQKWLQVYNLFPICHSILPPNRVPVGYNDQWRRFTMGIWLKYLRDKKNAVIILAKLENAGIASAVLRGMAISHWLYPDPVLRPMGDVDILIDRKDCAALLHCLAREGYKPVKKLRSQYVFMVEETCFEFHWSYLTTKRYRSAADFSQWLTRRHKLPLRDGSFHCLAKEDEFLDLVCHAFIHHDIDRPLQLVDIGLALVRDDLDWLYIGKWIEESSLKRIFSFSISYVNELLDLGIMARFADVPWAVRTFDPALFEAYAAVVFGPDSRSHYLARKKHLVWVTEKLSDRFRQILRFFSGEEVSMFLKVMAQGQLKKTGDK